jgi:hypothetical protein
MGQLLVTVIINKEEAETLIEIEKTWAEFQRKDGTIVVRLLKALYGCIELAGLWYQLAKDALPSDSCIFNKYFNDVQCTVAIYVDDFLLTCESEDILDEVKI